MEFVFGKNNSAEPGNLTARSPNSPSSNDRYAFGFAGTLLGSDPNGSQAEYVAQFGFREDNGQFIVATSALTFGQLVVISGSQSPTVADLLDATFANLRDSLPMSLRPYLIRPSAGFIAFQLPQGMTVYGSFAQILDTDVGSDWASEFFDDDILLTTADSEESSAVSQLDGQRFSYKSTQSKLIKPLQLAPISRMENSGHSMEDMATVTDGSFAQYSAAGGHANVEPGVTLSLQFPADLDGFSTAEISQST